MSYFFFDPRFFGELIPPSSVPLWAPSGGCDGSRQVQVGLMIPLGMRTARSTMIPFRGLEFERSRQTHGTWLFLLSVKRLLAACFPKRLWFSMAKTSNKIISTTTGKIKLSVLTYKGPASPQSGCQEKIQLPLLEVIGNRGYVMRHLCLDIIWTSLDISGHLWTFGMPTEALSIHYGISLGDYPNDARIHAGWAG